MWHMTCIAIVVIPCITTDNAMNQMPARLARADEPKKGSAKPVPLKLAKPDAPLILLDTMVDEKGPFRFILDTGAGATIISPDLAKKLDIQPATQDKPEKATGAGGDVEIQFGVVKSLRVGETRLEGLKVGIMDLAGISKAIETDIDGIIGYNFLKHFRVTIDYPMQTVTIEKSE
jgi:predicted aspartyl protease